MEEFGIHNGRLAMRRQPHCQTNKNFAGGKDLVPSSLLCNLPAHFNHRPHRPSPLTSTIRQCKLPPADAADVAASSISAGSVSGILVAFSLLAHISTMLFLSTTKQARKVNAYADAEV
eukprot:scaffold80289_cov23-Cyclotella_meneghiniana.AAC.2